MIPGPSSDVTLREVVDADRDHFFTFMQDPGAIAMAAFTPEDPSDREAFDSHWDRILASDSVTMRTVVAHGEVTGSVGSYEMDGSREVTYWIGRPFWGAGIATHALRRFLEIDAARPIHARVATDNFRSISVLENCGFKVTDQDEGFAHGRGEIVAEYVMTLDA